MKRIFSLLLTLVMICGMFTFSASMEDEESLCYN